MSERPDGHPQQGGFREIKIGHLWTYGDLGCFLAPNPTIAPPSTKTTYVDIPAADGALDLTEALTDEPVYNNRQLTFTLVFPPPERNWTLIRRRLENETHGQKVKIIMPDDMATYFIGRIESSSFTKDKSVAYLKIVATCEPWRYKNIETVHTVVLTEAQDLVLLNERKTVAPTIKCDGAVNVTIGESTVALQAGEWQVEGFYLKAGVNPVRLVNPTPDIPVNVSITYREATL